jgi:hypothetical protein
MDPRAIATLAAALAAGGCHRPAAEPAPAPRQGAPAIPAIEDAGWPTHLEFRIIERSTELAHGGATAFTLETKLPVFRSEPPGIAALLNARMARLGRPDVDPRTHEGEYTIDCTVELANRYAVILDCSQQLDQRRRGDAERDEDGPSVESRHLAFGWWLRRGLPELSLEQFAPELDLRAALEVAARSQPAGCDLRACAFDPRSFLLDGEGLTLIATGDCAEVCDPSIPSIPLDRLAPTHAWAAELVRRIRRRVEAGVGLVEGDLTR